eukprot:gnl/TRDRNA2_/TRDRNA2_92817_c1_seq1.p1 gnl/TRDRNA2_/TRDRNA2_92817_c1~~gnl/TRDRNA2_/TRDRNA2_92817_c1_seq1.p1  ORF type:complete len:266 (-),score=26.79 gnl/TRDRNA2_/TRDRNA2_92817_c1_seq1:317-1057(-)
MVDSGTGPMILPKHLFLRVLQIKGDSDKGHNGDFILTLLGASGVFVLGLGLGLIYGGRTRLGKRCVGFICLIAVVFLTTIVALSPLAGFLVPLGIGQLPCSEADKLPTISFTVAGKDFDVGPDFYVTSGEGLFCSVQLSYDPQLDPDLVVLGIPFLRKYYTVFDAEQARMGFATAKVLPADPAKVTSRVESTSPVFAQCLLTTAMLVILILCVVRTGEKPSLMTSPLLERHTWPAECDLAVTGGYF